MVERLMTYRATVTGKRQITIPAEICKMLDINTGNQVDFAIIDDKIVFKKAIVEDDNICPICNHSVSVLGNMVNYEGKKYHMECWFSKENEKLK